MGRKSHFTTYLFTQERMKSHLNLWLLSRYKKDSQFNKKKVIFHSVFFENQIKFSKELFIILSESRNYPNCVHWRIFYFMWLRRIYEFFCIHSNPIWKGRNCRDYRPSHLKFREYFRPFWFSRYCVVVAYFNRRMRSSNVQGFVSRLLTLYEEEDSAPL